MPRGRSVNTIGAQQTIDQLVNKRNTMIGELELSMSATIEAAVALEEQEELSGVEELKKQMQILVSLEGETQKHIEALRKVARGYERHEGEDSYNGEAELEKFLTESDAEIDLLSHSKYKEFRLKVWRIHHPGEALPDQDDDEILVVNTNEEGDLRCPLTQKMLEDPVTSKICGHTYSRVAIEAHIRQLRRRTNSNVTCPIAGCGARLTNSNLETDLTAAQRLRSYKFRAKRRRVMEEVDESDVTRV